MRLSEVSVKDLARQAVEDEDAQDYSLLPAYLDAAKNAVLSYTGLTQEEADEKPELAVAALVIGADLVKNKEASVDDDKVNQVLGTFMDMHRKNLL